MGFFVKKRNLGAPPPHGGHLGKTPCPDCTKGFKLEQIMIVQIHADDGGNGKIFVFFEKKQ